MEKKIIVSEKIVHSNFFSKVQDSVGFVWINPVIFKEWDFDILRRGKFSGD